MFALFASSVRRPGWPTGQCLGTEAVAVEAVMESTVGTSEEAGVGTNVEDGLRLRAICYGEGW